MPEKAFRDRLKAQLKEFPKLEYKKSNIMKFFGIRLKTEKELDADAASKKKKEDAENGVDGASVIDEKIQEKESKC